MKQVWKYPLHNDDVQCVQMPEGAEILSVMEQNGTVVLYALVDPFGEAELRTVYMYGTGHDIDSDDAKFVGTVSLQGEALMFHVFAR